MVAGISITRKPRMIKPISSSDAWYCGWLRITAPVTDARIARMPNDVSVDRKPVSTRTSVAKNRVPARRT